MTRYLLDANAIIAILNDPASKPARRLRRERQDVVSVSSIVRHELFFGAFKSSRAEGNLARIDAMQLFVLDFDREDARAAGILRADLKRHGTPIGSYDVLIAGQALARGLILVTHNTREFGRVPGLKLEDWEI